MVIRVVFYADAGITRVRAEARNKVPWPWSNDENAFRQVEMALRMNANRHGIEELTVSTARGPRMDDRPWLEEISRPVGESTIGLSAEELAVLARAAALPLVPLLRYDPLDALGSADRPGVEASTGRRLRDDGIIEPSGAVAEPVRALLELLAAPYLVGRVELARDGMLLEWHYACTPDAAVEAVELEEQVWRFSAFPVGELVDRMCTLVGLAERPWVESGPVDVLPELMAEVSALLGRDETPPAEEVAAMLARGGADPAAATALARALLAPGVGASVTLLYQPSDHQLAGGKLDWLDTGESGLWLVPLPDQVEDPVGTDPASEALEALPDERGAADVEPPLEFRSVTASWIRKELRSFLPSAQ